MRTPIALMQAYFDAFNAHDAEAMLSTLSDDVTHDINEGSTEVGIEAFRAFKAHMDRCYREEIRDLVLYENGSRGVAEFTCAGTYLQTDGSLPEAHGQTYAIHAAAFFEVANDRIVRIRSYYNLREWIAAVS